MLSGRALSSELSNSFYGVRSNENFPRSPGRQAAGRAAYAGAPARPADRGVHHPADADGGVRVPARVATAGRVVPRRARAADRTAGGAGDPVPHHPQRRPAGGGGHRGRARGRRGVRVHPVQLVCARAAHRGRARARADPAAARGPARGTDQRHADLLRRLPLRRDQPHHRDAGRCRRRAGGRAALRPAARPAGQGSGRRPQPADGRPARPDGGRAGRGGRLEACYRVAGAHPGAARRGRAGRRRAQAGRGKRPAEPPPAPVRQPGGWPAGRRRHAGASGYRHADAGAFGG